MAKIDDDKPSLPKKVAIGPLEYAIKHDKNTNRNAGTDGLCDHDNVEILLIDHMAPGQERFTLMHEICHAIVSVAGMATGQDPMIEDEEAFVSLISGFFLDFIRRNHDVVSYMQEK